MNSQLPLSRPPEEERGHLAGAESDQTFIPPQARQAMEKLSLEKAYKSAAGNFYAIAGFSFLNSLLWLFGLRLVFVIGLGITQFMDGVAYAFKQYAGEAGFIFTAAGLVFDVAACLTFVLFGYFTSRAKTWALVTGMILYGLDAVLTLLFKDWLGLAFHVFFLWQIWMMYRVIGYWRRSDRQQVDPFSRDIGVS